MSAFATIGGMFIVKDGKFAAGEDCCCKGSFLLPEGGPNPICIYMNTIDIWTEARWRTSQAVPICDSVGPNIFDCRFDNYRDAVLRGTFRGSVEAVIRFGDFTKTTGTYKAKRELGGVGVKSCRALTKTSEFCVVQYNGEISSDKYEGSPDYWKETCIDLPQINIDWYCNPFYPWNLGRRYCYTMASGVERLYPYNPGGTICRDMDDLPTGCEIVSDGIESCWFSIYVAANVDVEVNSGTVVSESVSGSIKHITSRSCSGHILLKRHQ